VGYRHFITRDTRHVMHDDWQEECLEQEYGHHSDDDRALSLGDEDDDGG
jgi:hypothetical protein